MGQMCEWNLKKNFNWGHFLKKLGAFFFKIGGNGANVLVEFEKKILTGGIFLKIGGIFFLNWGQKIILGSRKSAFFGNCIDPCFDIKFACTEVKTNE